MSHAQISVPLSKEQAFALVDAVFESEELALTATAREAADDEWVFEAICEEEPNIDAFNALAKQVLGGAVTFSVEPIDTEFDWVSKSLEDLKPVAAGGFYIYGSHNADTIPTGATPLHIDAAQAFGTGHHETTTGCLEAIAEVLKRRKPRFMIDVGTGTGVLAIALTKRTKLPVIATDIDPIAVTVTDDNAKLNNVANNIITVEATGVEHRLINENGPYDLIVANILAGPLKQLAPSIGDIAAPGATIILSGILARQATGVVVAYGAQDIVFKKKTIKGDWATLTLERAKSPYKSFED